jgi:8-oxo-dGTP pyrophosphatase MutT (NUDIX family)
MERTENMEPPTCSGEVILIIFNLASSCILVRRKETNRWFFPMGVIKAGEGIIDAARREAIEEVGVVIEPLGVPLCQNITLALNNMTFQRWHIVIVAETATSVLHPKDEKIEEARFFDVLPPVSDIAMMS